MVGLADGCCAHQPHHFKQGKQPVHFVGRIRITAWTPTRNRKPSVDNVQSIRIILGMIFITTFQMEDTRKSEPVYAGKHACGGIMAHLRMISDATRSLALNKFYLNVHKIYTLMITMGMTRIQAIGR